MLECRVQSSLLYRQISFISRTLLGLALALLMRTLTPPGDARDGILLVSAEPPKDLIFRLLLPFGCVLLSTLLIDSPYRAPVTVKTTIASNKYSYAGTGLRHLRGERIVDERSVDRGRSPSRKGRNLSSLHRAQRVPDEQMAAGVLI